MLAGCPRRQSAGLATMSPALARIWCQYLAKRHNWLNYALAFRVCASGRSRGHFEECCLSALSDWFNHRGSLQENPLAGKSALTEVANESALFICDVKKR